MSACRLGGPILGTSRKEVHHESSRLHRAQSYTQHRCGVYSLSSVLFLLLSEPTSCPSSQSPCLPSLRFLGLWRKTSVYRDSPEIARAAHWLGPLALQVFPCYSALSHPIQPTVPFVVSAWPLTSSVIKLCLSTTPTAIPSTYLVVTFLSSCLPSHSISPLSHFAAAGSNHVLTLSFQCIATMPGKGLCYPSNSLPCSFTVLLGCIWAAWGFLESTTQNKSIETCIFQVEN
jgi:hypothetical protein